MSYHNILDAEGTELAAALIGKTLVETKGRLFPEIKQSVQERKSNLHRANRAVHGHTSSNWSKAEDNVCYLPYGYTVCLLDPLSYERANGDGLDKFRELIPEFAQRVDVPKFMVEKGEVGAFRLLTETKHFALLYLPRGKYNEFKAKHPEFVMNAKLGTYTLLKAGTFMVGATAGFENTFSFVDVADGANDMVLPNAQALQTTIYAKDKIVGMRGKTLKPQLKTKSPMSAGIRVLGSDFLEVDHRFRAYGPTICYVDQVTPAYVVKDKQTNKIKKLHVHKVSSMGIHHLDGASFVENLNARMKQSDESKAELPWAYGSRARCRFKRVRSAFGETESGHYIADDLSLSSIWFDRFK